MSAAFPKPIKPHYFNPDIIREYDIRGTVGQTLDTIDSFYIGLSFGTYIAQSAQAIPKICIGYDGRLSTPDLFKTLCEGLIQTGADATTIGLCPSPMLYYAVYTGDYDAGIMVTGSHNPASDNGFKMMLKSRPVFGQSVRDIAQIAQTGHFHLSDHHVPIKAVDIMTDYINRLLQDLDNARPLKIVWDCGNGSTGEVLRNLVIRLPGEHVLLYDEIDGAFPNHHPDPTIDDNLKDLQDEVLKQQADFGIAMDGDGDRIGVVDDTGRVIRADTLLSIYAEDVLKTHPGATIIGDVKCSQTLFDKIEQLGGKPDIWKTGHSLIKARMIEQNAPLAGELSGHIFFADKYYGYDDALYCAIRLMNALQNRKLSAIIDCLSTLFNTPEIRIKVDEREKFSIIKTTADRLKNKISAIESIFDLDGIRVVTADGWWLLRASNTQAALVVRAESQTEAGLEKLLNMLRGELAKSGIDATIL